MALVFGTEVTNIIGLVAGFCTTIAFVPQVVKIWRTRSTADLSLSMFLIFLLGIVLWLSYGLIRNDYPVVIANFLTLILAGIILGFKVRYK